MNRNWSNDIKKYDLFDGYTIEKADYKEFAVYFAVYVMFNKNSWFRQSFEVYCSNVEENDPCYWIIKDEIRIGGVIIEPNSMGCLFLIPPFDEYDTVIAKLKSLLYDWSDKDKEIEAYSIKPDQIRHFQMNGFYITETRRCMIRPTEEFDVVWDEKYNIAQMPAQYNDEIEKLVVEAFTTSGELKNEADVNNEIEGVKYYFDVTKHESIENKASTLVYDKETGELVAACLVSIWENWPNVYEIAVKPAYQKKGLAVNMLKKALTVLKSEYPVLRLFVTLGNNAEMVYHKMGFLPGMETSEMVIPSTVKK